MQHGKANVSLKIDELFRENPTKSHLLPGPRLPLIQGTEGGPGPLAGSPSVQFIPGEASRFA